MGFSERTFELCAAKGGSVGCFDPNRSRGSNGYRIAASICCTSKNALGTEKGRKLQDNHNSFTPWPSERICGQSWWP
jgi:hypothetical protein